MTTECDSRSLGEPALPPRFPVLSVGISAITLDDAVRVIGGWIDRRERHYVNVCTSDTVLKCHDDPELADVVTHAGLATPDGMPLVWVGRLQGHRAARVYGPDLMLALCAVSREPGYRHFFFGSTDAVLAVLTDRLRQRFPRLEVAGTYAPPFRPLTPEEERSVADMINAARPDIVWVALGTPKQDYWVGRFRPLLEAPALIAIGAAFDFHSGRLPQAPRWMMRCGLEWVFRLCVDPRHLWRRYLLGNPRFVCLVLKQLLLSPGRRRTAT